MTRTMLKDSPDAAELLLATVEVGADGAEELMGETDCEYGCVVEPDGRCPHGYRSAGLTAGLI